MQNPGILEFNIGGNIYTFDTISYMSNLGYKRKDMPQIGVYELLKNEMYKKLIESYKVGIVHTKLPIKMLQPTQIDIDYDRVRIDIAKYGWDDQFERPLLVSNDMRIVDGHHQHVRWMIMQPERITEVLIVDMPIRELLHWLKNEVIPYFNITKSIPENFKLDEDFGNQGPEAIPGMGSVTLPTVTQAGNTLIPDGSGDLQGVIRAPLKIQKKDKDDELSVDEALVIMNAYQSKKLAECQQLFALELDNKLMESANANNEEGKQLIADLKGRVSNFLSSFGFRYNESGTLERYCKDKEGNETWVVSESMGDISNAHKYYPEFGGYFTEDEVHSGKALKAYESTRGNSGGRFFTKDELIAIGQKHREENGDDWLEKLREQQKQERINWKISKIEELQSGKNLEQKYGMMSIGDAIVKLASTVFSIHQIDISDDIIQFVHRKIEETKEFINSPIDENLNEAKDKQIPLDVHFTREQISEMDDLITCMNKPVKRQFKIIDTAFSCQTLEGITHGKAGDCLVVGIDGEIYPCDKSIFDDTYVALEADKIQEDLINAVKTILDVKGILEQAKNAYLVEKFQKN